MELSDKALRMSRVGMNHEVNHKYSVEKRIDVVTKTMALGNMRLVSELTGISYALIREWKTQPWWAELVDEIRASRNSALDTKLSKLVDRSLETVADRLENGNLFMNKQGELARKPLTVLEANKIAVDMLTQETLVQKRQAQETSGMQAASVADQIRMLAQEFAKFNTKRTVDIVAKTIHEPTEEIVNALYEERETGLPETVRPVRWEAESNSSTLGAQSSESSGGEGVGSNPLEQGRGSYQASEQGWSQHSEQSEGSEPESQSFILPQL